MVGRGGVKCQARAAFEGKRSVVRGTKAVAGASPPVRRHGRDGHALNVAPEIGQPKKLNTPAIDWKVEPEPDANPARSWESVE